MLWSKPSNFENGMSSTVNANMDANSSESTHNGLRYPMIIQCMVCMVISLDKYLLYPISNISITMVSYFSMDQF